VGEEAVRGCQAYMLFYVQKCYADVVPLGACQ
jgi:hypothetical protein